MTTITRPLPNLDREETKPFWEACKRHELQILVCNACKGYVWYPQRVCHRCNSHDLAWRKMSGKGRIFSYVVLRHPLHPWFADKLPLAVALVELADAPEVRLTSTVLECKPEDVRVGMDVEVVFQKINDDLTMPYFRPVRRT
ncbi:MAG: OB-fold domain-containing protein [Chloroflexi bacterium]|nr:OB-fold domain-containing protein [Chloroflexota bacterium]